MDFDRPKIPKRLAARIRGAQTRVVSTWLSIICDEQRILQDSSRIAEFEADPALFARTHYCRHGVDSYPVQSNITRCRNALARCRQERSSKQEEQNVAEYALKEIEQGVLSAVAKMRSSPGRVPWPASLPSFEEYRAEIHAEWRQTDEEFAANRLIDDADFERAVQEEEAQIRDQIAEEDRHEEKMRRDRIARMSPEEQRKEQQSTDRIKSALSSGKLSLRDIIVRVNRRG